MTAAMLSSPSICGVLLAGGRARRMGGGDKSLLLLDADTILAHAARALRPQCAQLVLNANGAPERFAAYGMPVIADGDPIGAGPLAGVLAGMDYARTQPRPFALIATSAADTPFLPHDFVARLTRALDASGADLAVAQSGGRTHYAAALWRISGAEILRAALRKGLRKAGGALDLFSSVAVEWPIEPFDPFFNINTSEDLAYARNLKRDPINLN